MALDIYQPVSFGKETFQCISFDENVFIMDWRMKAGGKVPTHFHRYMDERFDITQGEVTFIVDGKEQRSSGGETVIIPKGVHHSVINNTSDDIACRVEYSPCSDTDKMFRIFGGIHADNPGDKLILAKYLYIARRRKLEEFSTIPPGMMALMFSMLTGLSYGIGRLAGWDRLAGKYLD